MPPQKAAVSSPPRPLSIVIRTRPLRASMIDPFFTCVGVTSGTNVVVPGTFTSTVPEIGSRFMARPAIGRGRPGTAETVTVWVWVVRLPAASVATARAVYCPGAAYACEVVSPAPTWPSPKSHATATGLLHVSELVTAMGIAVPAVPIVELPPANASRGAALSITNVPTVLLDSGHATWTLPAGSAEATGGVLPTGPSVAPPSVPPRGRTA